VTDYLLLAILCLSIETKMPYNVPFGGGMCLSFIQERLIEEGYKISLR